MEYATMFKPQRNRFVGPYREPPAPPIDLPFTLANLRALLADGARPEPGACYPQQRIKEWASGFWWKQLERSNFLDIAVAPDIEQAADLAPDVAMQWGRYRANTYTLAKLRALDFSHVCLP